MYRAGLVLGTAVFIVGILEWFLLLFHYTEFLEKIAPWLGANPTRISALISAGIVIFVIAWIKRKEESAGTSDHKSVQPSSGVTQTASPSFTQSGATQKIEIHNHPPASPSSTEPTEKQQRIKPTHNVIFQGARRIKFDFDMTREVNEDDRGIIAIKACFLNRSIPGKVVSDFDYAKARIVYKTTEGREIAEISDVTWIRPEGTAKYVHMDVNRPECLVLAFWGDDIWVAPYVTWRKPEYWEDADQAELDGKPLPFDEVVVVEITVVGGGGIGLEPDFVYMVLGSEGEAVIGSNYPTIAPQ